MDEDLNGTLANGRQEKFAKLGRDVLVNVLGSIIAAPIVYLAGAAFGLFRRTPAALTASAAVLAAVLTAASVVIMLSAVRTSRSSRSTKLRRVYLAAGISALAPGVLLLTLGLDGINRVPAFAAAFIVFGIGFLVVAGGLLHSARKNYQN